MKVTKRIVIMVLATATFLLPTLAVSGQSTAGLPRVVTTGRAQETPFTVVQLVSDLAHPWSFTFMPDGAILITEQLGRLFRYAPGGSAQIQEIGGVPRVSANGQGGLLDIALHPDYADNGWIYLTYSSRYRFADGTTLARARLAGSGLTDVEQLFRMDNPSLSGNHFGSRLAFGSDGTLFITIGERGSRDRAQDLGDHAGSVLRLNADGSVPADNPFVGRNDVLPEIYSYGHRNPQGLAINPWSGDLWLHEHGPRGGDEVNVVLPGANYGWPVISYGAEYSSGRPVGEGTSRSGMEQPLIYWVPSIAPSGMAFYDGDVFESWSGDLFVGALAGEHLRRVDLDGDSVVGQEVLLQGVVGRIRDVRVGPDGLIYFITDENRGGLYRLEPAR
jgi:aldose sugar dehydrogenase